MNPIFLKEIRQSVRSRLISVSLIGIFLLLLVVIGILFANDANDYYSHSGRTNSDLGSSTFYTVTSLLLFVSFIVIPYGAFHRLISEHQKGATDLLFTTPLAPRKIIDGKLMSNASLALLFLAATLPFILLSYQLHGVEPTYIAVLVIFFLPTVLCLLSIALTFALLPFPPVITRILFVLLNLFYFIFFPIGIAGGTYYTGRSSFNENALIVLGTLLASTALFRAASIFIISPPESNRAIPLRKTLLLLWLILTLLMILWPFLANDTSVFYVLSSFTFGVLVLLLLHAISLRPTPSRRTLAEIRPRFRFLQYLLYTTSDGGVLLYLFLSLLSFLLGILSIHILHDVHYHHILTRLLDNDLIPSFFYFTATALLYRRIGIHFRFLRHPTAMMIAPPLFFMIACGFYSCFYEILPTVHPHTHTLLSAILFGLSILLFLPGTIRSYRAFHAPAKPL